MKILFLILLLSCNKKINEMKNINKHYDEVDISNEEAVLSAMHVGDPELVRLQIEYLEDVNKKIGRRGTLLHAAAEIGNPLILKVALSKGMSTLVPNVYAQYPFEVAKNKEVKSILEEYGLREELSIAINRKEKDVLEILLESLADNKILFLKVNNKNLIDELVESLSWSKDKEIIRLFLEKLTKDNSKYSNKRLSYLRRRILEKGLKEAYKEIKREDLREYVNMLEQEKAIDKEYEASNKKNSSFGRIAIRNGWRSYFNQFIRIEGREKTATVVVLEFIENNDNFIKNFLQYEGEGYIKDILRVVNKNDGIELSENNYSKLAMLYSKSSKSFGQIKKLSQLFFTSISLNKTLEYYKTFFEKSIEKAFEEKNEELLLSLLNENEEIFINYRNKNNKFTVLHLAVKNELLNIIKAVLDKGMDINCYSDISLFYIDAPLHMAVRKNNKALVEYLLKNNADINIKSGWKESAVYIAFENENKELVEFLISRGANTKDTFRDGKTLLHLAMEKGDKDFIHYLLTSGLDINQRDNKGIPPLFYLINHLCENIVTKVSQEHHNFEIKENFKKDIDFIKYLVSKGSDVRIKDTEGNRITYFAIRVANYTYKARWQIIKTLIEAGAEASPELLFIFCGIGSVKKVNYLLEKGVNLRSLNSKGEGALYLATERFNEKLVNFLISKGLRVKDFSEKQKSSILHLLCSYKRVFLKTCSKKLFELILRDGLDINTRNKHGNIPLHYSCGMDLEFVEFLLQKGSKVNQKDNKGKTFIHYVIEFFELQKDNGYSFGPVPWFNRSEFRCYIEKILELAHNYGANFAIQDNEGKTALHYLADFVFKNSEQNFNQSKVINCLISKMDQRGIYLKDNKDRTAGDYLKLNAKKHFNINIEKIRDMDNKTIFEFPHYYSAYDIWYELWEK